MSYDQLTMSQLLVFYSPRILELQERWVDLLLEAEGALDGKDGMCLISCLFRSRKLQKFNFSCERFKKLLNEQKNRRDASNQTILAELCKYNPSLLS